MQMKQRDEEKRSKAWVVAMLASSVIILLVVVFFVTESVVQNPLEGEWYSEEKGYHLEIDDDELTVEATIEGEYIEVDMYYTIDKNDKVITLKSSAAAYADAADDTDGKLSAGEIDEALSEFVASYNYSVEGDKLTLTEREFANKFIFTRVE